MLFENIVRLRRIQPPDVVAFEPAVSNGSYPEVGGINPEMVGNLMDFCGKVRGQGYSVGGDYWQFSSARTLGRSNLRITTNTTTSLLLGKEGNERLSPSQFGRLKFRKTIALPIQSLDPSLVRRGMMIEW